MGKGVGKGRLSGNKKSFICSSLFRYYIKQIDSMLPCVCSVIDHRRRQNVVRTLATHSALASCATFLFVPHFDVICDLLLNRRTATWNPFLIIIKFPYNALSDWLKQRALSENRAKVDGKLAFKFLLWNFHKFEPD